MKKTVFVFVLAMFAATFVGCGNGSAPGVASGSSNDASTATSSSSASTDASDSSDAQRGSGELRKFRNISGNFNQAWTLNEGTDSNGTAHAVVLLLSEDHDYCAYIDLEQGASSGITVSYTFGKTSVSEEGQDVQSITVQHNGDADELIVVFDAWGRADMASVKDPWGGVNDLTLFDDVDSAVSFSEDILMQVDRLS